MEEKTKRITPDQLYKGWKLLLTAQLLIMLILCILALFHRKTLVFLEAGGQSEASARYLQIEAGAFTEDGSYRIDETDGVGSDVCMKIRGLSLQWGVYRLEIAYDADAEQAVRIVDESLGYRELVANTISLYDRTKAERARLPFFLKRGTDNAEIQVLYTGMGALAIKELKLVHTGQEYFMLLVLFAGLCVLVDAGYYFSRCAGNGQKGKGKVYFALLGIILLACTPGLVNYQIKQDDIYFHFLRMEGLLGAWKDGQFPARLQPNWLNGAGYPVSVMYGDLSLLPFLLFRLAGFQMNMTYKLGAACYHAITAIVCYLCFHKMFQDDKIALTGSTLYTLSLYRLYNIYMRASIGEYAAMVFWPILALGCFQLFGAMNTRKERLKTACLLIIGFGGLLQTHILSFETGCFFMLLVCAARFGKLLREGRLWLLLKSALLCVLLNLWFLVPFLDYALHQDLTVFHVDETIQNRGIYWQNLFLIFPWAGKVAFINEAGMRNLRPIGPGIALMIGMLGFWYYGNIARKAGNVDSREYRLGRCALVLGIAASLCCLDIFPWDSVSQLGGIFRNIVTSLQFPYRFLGIACICFTITSCCLLFLFKMKKQERLFGRAVTVLTAAAVFTLFFFGDDLLQSHAKTEIEVAESFGTEQIGGREYLHPAANPANLRYDRVNAGAGVEIQEYQREGTKVRISCQNMGAGDSYIELPLLYYLGYQAKDMGSKEKMTLEAGENQVVRVILPEHYHGTVSLHFDGMWYWKAADLFSFIVLVCCIAYLLFCRGWTLPCSGGHGKAPG